MAEKSMKEQLEESFERAEEQEEEETGGSEEDTEEPTGDTEETIEEEPADELVEEETKSEEPLESVSEDALEELPSESEFKAPVSWKPAIREHWEKLPVAVQEEITRREADINKGLQQAAGHRKVAEEYVNTIKPFEQMIRAANASPSQAIGAMFQSAQTLTFGSPVQKAEVVRDIINNYKVDVETLDSILAGQQVPDDYSPLMKQIDDRLTPINNFMNQFNTAQEQQTTNVQEQVNAELEEFSKNEFYEDVREDMADLMELAYKRNRSISLQEAYDQACNANPEISKIISQRAKAAEVSLDKKTAASSLPSKGPTGHVPSTSDMSLREVLEKSFEDSSERI